MNIIEAIKNGKHIRRKVWEDKGYLWVDAMKRTQSAYFTVEDILVEDWEIKEESNNFGELIGCPELPFKEVNLKKEIKFDPTKPVKTTDGRKARILCTNFKSNHTKKSIVCAVEGKYGEDLLTFYESGKYSNDYNFEGCNLINIPEPEEKGKIYTVLINLKICDRDKIIFTWVTTFLTLDKEINTDLLNKFIEDNYK